jgi:hypothetical protein
VVRKSNRVAELLEQSASIENDRDESSSDSSESTGTSDLPQDDRNLDSVLASLRREIRCLNDLNASLKSPALDLERNDDVADVLKMKDIAPHHSYSSSITENFQNVASDLAEHLGKCNFLRSQYLRELRSRMERETEALNLPDTTLRLAKTERSGNDDSGYGTLAAPTVYAPSTASSRLTSLASGERSKYPPLPDLARSGSAFDCLACGRDIIAKETRQWR